MWLTMSRREIAFSPSVDIRMSAQADTKGPDIFNFVSATLAHLAKTGVKSCVVMTCRQHVGNICS